MGLITYLLDTDTCIHALKKRNRALATKILRHEGLLALSDVTMFELNFGAKFYEQPHECMAIISEFSSNLQVLPFNTNCANHAADIRYALAPSGNMIGPYDALIAATALAHNLILVSGNAREFSRIKGLRLENWNV